MRVAIIGAGPCGVTSIKCCLDEGLEPVCFEKGSDLGGLWRYTTTECDHTSVYNACVMVTSKEMSCFRYCRVGIDSEMTTHFFKVYFFYFYNSDFPIPKHYPLYLPHALAKVYLNLYADNYHLRSHISFNTKVVKVSHSRTDNKDQWKITYEKRSDQDQPTNTTETEVFDAVLVCSGHHWQPSVPQLPGTEKFRGEMIHSTRFREARDFYGKNVLVVGKCENLMLTLLGTLIFERVIIDYVFF
jgi:dimethylaniline monooxygenase (N-oxide forming)